MTDAARLCLEAAIAMRALMKADFRSNETLMIAVNATDMDVKAVLARGEEELRLMEAEEG